MITLHSVKKSLPSAVRCLLRDPLVKCNTRTLATAVSPPTISRETTNGPLAGVKIVDLTRVLAGPFCTQILADYGADVIKVEDVGKGDDTRYWMVKGEKSAWKPEAGPMSNYFAAVNRNKRSICLNLKHQKGRETLLGLVREADVVVDNFKPGTLERLNLGYDVLSALNPRIIHASISGYGATGPCRTRPGYDMIAGAEAGLLHLTGTRDGPPVRPGLGLTDMSTGLFAHGAIMAALFSRQSTGLGQRINASLFETQIALLTNAALSWLNLGVEAERWGAQHPSVVPYDAWKTKDLYIVVGAANDRQFESLCNIINRPELFKDDRFRTNENRVRHRDELSTILNDVFKSATTDEWMALLEGKGLPYAPINTLERVFSHPQTAATNMVTNVPFDAAVSNNINLLGPAVKFNNAEASVRRTPPRLGEHTDEVLRELKLSESEIGEMHSNKTV